MLSAKDFFYGQAEPVWIEKAEKKDDKKGGGDSSSKTVSEKPQYPIWPIYTAAPYHPYPLNYNPEYIPTPPKKDDDAEGKANSNGKDKKKETKVEMWVPMCCSECEDLVRVAIKGLQGVKSVECNSYNKKVTVVATTAAPADILIECRRLFKKSRMWSDDD